MCCMQEGCTALHVACSSHCIDVALCLLSAHATVDLLDNVITSSLTNFFLLFTIYTRVPFSDVFTQLAFCSCFICTGYFILLRWLRS